MELCEDVKPPAHVTNTERQILNDHVVLASVKK